MYINVFDGLKKDHEGEKDTAPKFSLPPHNYATDQVYTRGFVRRVCMSNMINKTKTQLKMVRQQKFKNNI